MQGYRTDVNAEYQESPEEGSGMKKDITDRYAEVPVKADQYSKKHQ